MTAQPAEPPCTDPYARWCDRERGRPPTYVDSSHEATESTGRKRQASLYLHRRRRLQRVPIPDVPCCFFWTIGTWPRTATCSVGTLILKSCSPASTAQSASQLKIAPTSACEFDRVQLTFPGLSPKKRNRRGRAELGRAQSRAFCEWGGCDFADSRRRDVGLFQCQCYGGCGMQCGRVEHWYGIVLRPDQQGNFGAAEDHAFSTVFVEIPDYGLVDFP